MNWTMPYPWTSRSDSVRRINMSSEPGNESFFCALRPIPRILSLRRRDCASQVQIGGPSRRKTISGAHARRMRIAMARVAAVDNRLRPISTGVERQSARASGRQAGGDPVGREVAYTQLGKECAHGNCFHKASSHAKMDASDRHNAAPSSAISSIAWARSMALLKGLTHPQRSFLAGDGNSEITRGSGAAIKKPSRSLDARYTSRYTITVPITYSPNDLQCRPCSSISLKVL
jgi:hypothetical protein